MRDDHSSWPVERDVGQLIDVTHVFGGSGNAGRVYALPTVNIQVLSHLTDNTGTFLC